MSRSSISRDSKVNAGKWSKFCKIFPEVFRVHILYTLIWNSNEEHAQFTMAKNIFARSCQCLPCLQIRNWFNLKFALELKQTEFWGVFDVQFTSFRSTGKFRSVLESFKELSIFTSNLGICIWVKIFFLKASKKIIGKYGWNIIKNMKYWKKMDS